MTLLRKIAAVASGGVVGLALVTLGALSTAAHAQDRGPRGEARIDVDAEFADGNFAEEVDFAEEAQPARRRARRRGRRRARRRFRYPRRDFRAGIYIGGDRFGLFLHERDFRRFRGRGRRAYHYRGRFGAHRYDRRFARAGHWYVSPRFHGFIGRACHPIYKRGFFDGYRVLIRARRCYDRFGRGFIIRGSRRIVEYY